jgi:hypothetical protein
MAIIVGIILLYYYGKKFYNKYFSRSLDTQKLFVANFQSSEYTMINDNDIVLPKNGFDYSVCFWLYVNDFYQYHNTWRHIFHKGPYDGKEVINFDNWDNLTANYREQAPGCWLHPSKPILRFVTTIQPHKEYCGMYKNKNSCIDKTYCTWDGAVCSLDRMHPQDLYNDDPIDYLDTNDGELILQYVDIEIEVNEIQHLAFVFDQKVLNVYIDGELSQTAKFMGDPIYNRNDWHFFTKNNFSGNLLNFNYFPDTINDKKIKELNKSLPNFDRIPKRRIVNNHIQNGNILNAATALL